MELLFKVLLIGVTASILAVTVYKSVPGISFVLSLAAAVLTLLIAMAFLEPLIDFLRETFALCGVSGVYTGPLLKCMAISILTMIGANLCKDAGQGSTASSIEIAGVVAALYAALPLLNTFLKMIGELI